MICMPRAHFARMMPASSPLDRLAVVLFSGGFDSTVALWWALANYRHVRAVTVDYGQLHRAELRAAESIVRLTPSERVQIKVVLPATHHQGSGPFIRGHGALMASLGAIGVGPDGADIIVGSLATDPYPDSTREYLRLVGAGFQDAKDAGATRVIAPLHAIGSKDRVAALGFELGAPWNLSWSCRGSTTTRPCGRCGSCESRSRIDLELTNLGYDPVTVRGWQRVYGSPHHAAFHDVDHELANAARQFASAGGVDDGQIGWRYIGPDGKARMTSLIADRNRWRLGARRANQVRHIRATGLLPNGDPWEVLVCGDGSVAATPEIPDLDTVVRVLLAQM